MIKLTTCVLNLTVFIIIFIQQRIIKGYVFRMYSNDKQIELTHKSFECISIIKKDNVWLKEVNQYSYTYYQI